MNQEITRFQEVDKNSKRYAQRKNPQNDEIFLVIFRSKIESVKRAHGKSEV